MVGGGLVTAAEPDTELRQAAMAWLDDHARRGETLLTQRQLAAFHFGQQRIPLMDRQRGIRKPATMDAALSFRTTFTPPGQVPPYDDAQGSDGLLRYKYRGTDPQHPENVALRRAYVERLTRLRLHQPVFRARVLQAYEHRCSMCRLRHAELLDAAHILPDGHPRGQPVVPNGLSLCKIHHAAYDQNFIGVRPDLVVEVRRDILDEIDGPMLTHGLQKMNGERLTAPRQRAARPDPDALEERYETFRSAI